MAVFWLLFHFILWYGIWELRYPLLFCDDPGLYESFVAIHTYISWRCLHHPSLSFSTCVCKNHRQMMGKWRKIVNGEKSNNWRRKWSTALNVSAPPCLELSTSFSGHLVALVNAVDTSSDEQGRWLPLRQSFLFSVTFIYFCCFWEVLSSSSPLNIFVCNNSKLTSRWKYIAFEVHTM